MFNCVSVSDNQQTELLHCYVRTSSRLMNNITPIEEAEGGVEGGQYKLSIMFKPTSNCRMNTLPMPCIPYSFHLHRQHPYAMMVVQS